MFYNARNIHLVRYHGYGNILLDYTLKCTCVEFMHVHVLDLHVPFYHQFLVQAKISMRSVEWKCTVFQHFCIEFDLQLLSAMVYCYSYLSGWMAYFNLLSFQAI